MTTQRPFTIQTPNPPPQHHWHHQHLSYTLLLMVLTGLLFSVDMYPQPTSYDYKLSRGLEVNIMKNLNIPYVHAELVIYYREKPTNPAFPQLTAQNIFDKNVKYPNNPIITTLQKLGNDFDIDFRPDFLLFKINFLPDKMPLFIRFLKHLYGFKEWLEKSPASTTYSNNKHENFVPDRFNDSIVNYWRHFFKKPDWKKDMAFQLAYHHFFPGSILGETLITPDNLKTVLLENIRSFYMNTYQLNNSRLIMKGYIDNPVILYATLEGTFATGKKIPPTKFYAEPININNRRKIYIFNSPSNEVPMIYWLESIQTSKNKNPAPGLVLNNILFGFPNGRIFDASLRMLDMGILRMQSEAVIHNGVTVICNTIRIRYHDMEKFILLADREKKKLNGKEIDRKESLDTVSYFYGRLKVNSQDIDNDINLILGEMPENNPQVTLAALNKEAEAMSNPVIVIVGNGKLIMESLPTLSSQVEIIDFH